MKQLTPRQGTKTGLPISAKEQSYQETTYAPSGDENRSVKKLKKHMQETTYTPSGDENLKMLVKLDFHAGNNLHPVRGRKQRIFAGIAGRAAKQLTPRQGTKTKERRFVNKLLWRNNLHPVRGRKLSTIRKMHKKGRKQLTPRQGTKTFFLLHKLSSVYETTYTPSGDENLRVFLARF